MAAPWFQIVALLGSHLPLPFTLGTLWTTHPVNFIVGGLEWMALFFTMIISFLYHTCLSTGMCALGVEALLWTQFDYNFAFGCIVVVFVLLLTDGIEQTPSENFWSSAVNLALIYSTMLVVFTRLQTLDVPLDPRTAMLIMTMGVMAVAVKFIVISRGRARIFSKFANVYVLVGLIFVAVALVFFLIAFQYWFSHSIWHLLSFTGFNPLFFGAFRNVPGLWQTTFLVSREWLRFVHNYKHANNGQVIDLLNFDTQLLAARAIGAVAV